MQGEAHIQDGYDLIILGLSRWDNALNSSTFNIAKEFARTHRVFYIDKPFSYKDYLQEKKLSPIHSRKDAIRYGINYCRKVDVDGVSFYVATPRMCLPINFLPDGRLYDWVSIYNRRLVTEVIQKLIHDFSIRRYVFFNSFLPTYFEVIQADMLQPLAKVYRSCDDISQEKYIARHGVRLEKFAAERADLVVASSFKLRQNLEKSSNRPVYRVANAADPEIFSVPDRNTIARPSEIRTIRGKMLLFTGRLSNLRIDYELLYKIASTRPFDTLVLVGLYDEWDLVSYGLRSLSNVIVVGLKPVKALREYLAFSDLTLIPFKKNTLTESIYPLKINEYLAAGKPVVSTNFSEDIRSFSPAISVADSHEGFLGAIERELMEFSEQKSISLINLSKENTWQHRGEEFRRLIQDAIEQRQK
ncbi:hypothetical protein MASR2M44_11310 [Bacteroidota bacterium]